MHRLVHLTVGALSASVVAMTVAYADHRPVIAVPGHPHVPAIVDGIDASYGVVVGEWGLYRPGHVAPTVIRPLVAPRAYYPGAFYPGSTPTGYYPATGRRPRYGRQEVEPPADRPLPTPAPTYYRSWGAGSAPGPVTEYPPYEPPQVNIEPRGRRNWQRDPRQPRPDRP